jgi:hypothetical protein
LSLRTSSSSQGVGEDLAQDLEVDDLLVRPWPFAADRGDGQAPPMRARDRQRHHEEGPDAHSREQLGVGARLLRELADPGEDDALSGQDALRQPRDLVHVEARRQSGEARRGPRMSGLEP